MKLHGEKVEEGRSASSVRDLGLRRALVIEPEPGMARFHAEQLASTEVTCRVVHSPAQARAALEEGRFDLAVVSLSFARRELAALVDGLRGAGTSRIVGVVFEDQRANVKGLDVLIVKPTPPDVLSQVAREEGAALMRSPAVLIPELIAMSALGSEQDSLASVAERLKGGLGADGVFLYEQRGRRRWARSSRGDARMLATNIERRVRDSVNTGARLIVPAVVTREDEQQHGEAAETLYAWRGGSSTGSGLTLALVFRGCVALPKSISTMMAALAERLAHEAGWQLVQDRLMTELDAVREVGGLDPLLGTWSRGLLIRLLVMMQSACARSGASLSVAVIDVVGMGEINDRYGHREGDGVLKYVAEVVVYVVRTHDVVARYEGDSIAVVFDGATDEQAAKVVLRLQTALSSQTYQTEEGDEITIRTIAGISPVVATDDPEAALSRAADAADRLTDGGVAMASPETEAPPTRRSVEPTLAGVTLGGGYRILHEIGSGGGGGVYRGEDLALRRPVAVKVLRHDLARNAEVVDRFRDEAATLASLRHPNLVQVYTFGVDNGIAYFVMELVEGESLFDTVQRCRKDMTRVSPARVATIVGQLCSALHTLHQSGIHHRDVKPANVLMDPFRDRAVLVDVGIASRAGEQSVMAGTPGYMAPEAAREGPVDPSADVYGLAATIYELLTLTPPWQENDDPIVTLRRQQSGPPRPPSRYRTDIGPVDDVLLRALEPKPHHRFPDVLTFGSALHAALREIDDTIPASSVRIPESVASSPNTPMPLGSAPTMSWNHAADSSQANTRAVVFRSLPRVVGARDAVEWRVALGRQRPHLAEALSPSAPPLGWLPSSWLIDLLKSPPGTETRDPVALGRDLGRATVRATFRRFFPASVATLSPTTVLQALPQIWRQYHTWGEVLVGPQKAESATIMVRRAPPEQAHASWIQGMLEQLVSLSGADDVTFSMPEVAPGATEPWAFTGQWVWAPGSDRPWR